MIRRNRQQINDSSAMVPMADMLSNTVGIMLFILAFTVLQTGGVFISKKLPMEHDAENKTPIYFACVNNRLLPLDINLIDLLYDGLGEPTFYTLETWVNRFNKKKIANEYFELFPEGSIKSDSFGFRKTFNMTVEFKPKSNVGYIVDDINNNNSIVNQQLSKIDPDKRYLFFFVFPDEIEIFKTVRDYANSHYGLISGWTAIGRDRPIIFAGGGSGTPPQPQ